MVAGIGLPGTLLTDVGYTGGTAVEMLERRVGKISASAQRIAFYSSVTRAQSCDNTRAMGRSKQGTEDSFLDRKKFSPSR
jgi:hypothetical protein